MAQFFDFDPLTGVTETFDYDEASGQARIIVSQDVSAALDLSRAKANGGLTDHGIKEGLWHYASLPAVVQVALRAKGLDIHSRDKGMLNRILKEIDENYPWCKTTGKTHRVAEIRHL